MLAAGHQMSQIDLDKLYAVKLRIASKQMGIFNMQIIWPLTEAVKWILHKTSY